MSMNDVKKGSFILFKDEFPCIVRNINVAKGGKHGSNKYTLFGRDLVTDKDHSMICNSHDRPHTINVSKKSLSGHYFEDNYVYAETDIGDLEPFEITDSDLVTRIIDCEDNDNGFEVSLTEITYQSSDINHCYNVVTGFKLID